MNKRRKDTGRLTAVELEMMSIELVALDPPFEVYAVDDITWVVDADPDDMVVTGSGTFRFDPDEWDDQNDPSREVRDAAAEVARTGDALYGSFRPFPEEEPDARS